MKQFMGTMKRLADRRSFLRTGVAATLGAGLAGSGPLAFVAEPAMADYGGRLNNGDIAILRFLAAAEIIESDLWQQYNELAGVKGGSLPYKAAIKVLDADMDQYITDNTDDEISHETFLNAYLVSKGVKPVNLDRFRTLPSSSATGARQIGRLTNLQSLSVDTSWWARYRSMTNPDLGATFPQLVTIHNRPAIPRNDGDLQDANHLQAIANTAAFHFGYIEQGGSSLYPSLAQRVSDVEVLRILLSIGGTEIFHFQTWHDKAGNAPPVSDNGLVFPDFTKPPFNGEIFQANKIMPEPCQFISRTLPLCSIVRPTATTGAGAARGTIQSFIQDGLFTGQPREFMATLQGLADAADRATRT